MTDAPLAGDDGECAASLGAWLRSVLAPGAALSSDSRALRPGDAFLAWPGAHSDGRRFVDAARAAGAAAVLYEARGAETFGLRGDASAAVRARAVDGLRALAGPIAAHYYGHPAQRLHIVAVTGTNGKTTSTQWMASGFSAAGRRCAVIGTLGSGIVDPQSPRPLDAFGLTTPDAVALQRMLAAFADEGAEVVAMEASSIGIDQGRLDGMPIETAVLTNFTRDHLDYHGSEEAYLAAKLRLFSWPGLRHALVNGDDPIAPKVLDPLASSIQSLAFGHLPGEHGWRARKKLSAFRIVEQASGSQVSIGGDYGRAEIRLQTIGQFNVVNALAAAGVWLMHGMPFDEAMRRLEALQPIPGRMQRIVVEGRALVVVDYAHTPDALMNVLQALRPLAEARRGALWCVFGAGGDRDPGKRPLMGMVVERHADHVVVTSDNPRSEAPFRIVSDIRAGFLREPRLTELDREQAIRKVLESAAPEDVVLIAGKGHETWQEIGGEKLPFSDLAVARRWLGSTQANDDA
ncbi:MAG: UDP-N-acetylmuramoyl-L-alanyl-D-glutamate--2,6-diaminopimelate ligase [Burkholderiaceae bacterium]|nr:UDP-N-acetylmuramoyl-L-alanyl-D-glutamate--2,6-diaminopimelate ligase [Burkholderiaceae bacterium]